ncbi:hypothetical protein F5I97DRAFT_1929649 [Phlebopus sp. FC_14]|nr:hypothetical protein F5I97DRAFT_1929649 [Phlebopus sp. FC_14]
MSAQSPPPLVFVSDPWDDEQHKVLDAAIHGAIHPLVSMPRDNPVAILPAIILLITNGDQQRMKMPDAAVLSQHSEQLFALLDEAVNLEQPTYRELRKLQILRAPKDTVKPEDISNKPNPQHIEALQHSFQKLEYRGRAVEGFFRYLTYNNELFCLEDQKYYGKFCSIVQSSGTGKSRLLTELRKKDVVVVYMNLRGKTERSGFPQRDDFPARALTENIDESEEQYTQRCCAFWIAIFHTLTRDLGNVLSGKVAEAISNWNDEMSDMGSEKRRAFFEQAQQEYEKMVPTGGKIKSPVEAVDDKMTDLSLDDSSKKTPSSIPGLNELRKAYADMLKALKPLFEGKGTNEPKIIFGIDEAHTLCVGSKWRPADVLCRTINMFSQHPDHQKASVWTAFASTTSKAGDFAAPRDKHNSSRVFSGGESLFTPYTDLGWDQFAPPLTHFHPPDAAKFIHIVGFGRPLWWSLVESQGVRGTMETAKFKLDGGSNPNADDHQLALLAQRFALHVSFGHPDSVAYVDSAVASYMGVCVAVTPDRVWKYTRYPSEPLLSCAAAQALHKPSKVLGNALQLLATKVNQGMIEKGGRGELASRVLLLLAKDLWVRRQYQTDDWLANEHNYTVETAELKDCSMIPVIDFLKFIFGNEVCPNEHEDFITRHFSKARINFSHWISMDAHIGKSQGASLETSAVQCCHTQPLIDKVIPIYFDDNESCRVSHIYISDKAKESASSDVHYITPKSVGVEDMSSPYIAILLDMGLEVSKLTVSKTSPSTKPRSNKDEPVPAWYIYAAGMYSDTFPFLQADGGMQILPVLQDLVKPRPLVDEPLTESLRNQVLYGSSCAKHHMEWEQIQSSK